MQNFLIIFLAKTVSIISNLFNIGSGGTWPGHIALKLNRNFIKNTIPTNCKVVLVAGTNGKTTTSTLISHILSESGQSVAHNKSGANQLNGIASALVSNIGLFSTKLSKDYLILEVDENVLPIALSNLTPDFIICLNLFRDQLDRYGEIDTIVKKWRASFLKLNSKTTLILNADDPQIAVLGANLKNKVLYFGLNENLQKKIEHGADSIFCPNCSSNLEYKSITFSHLGNWLCPKCKLKRPDLNLNSWEILPLSGTYNKYNTLASVLFAKTQKIDFQKIDKALRNFSPAFGRQEEFEINGKSVELLLSKNPTGFNESLQTAKDLGAKNILLILNDRFVDGIDVSWIWDIDFENSLIKNANIAVSGERIYDMALRLKYAGFFTHVFSNLENAINTMANNLENNEKLYILANYSAMLETRKILTGRKIL